MKPTEHDVATVEYYAVRIYRRYGKDVAEDARLAGIVENIAGQQNAFHNEQELWQLLLKKGKGRTKRRRLAD